MDNLQPQPNLPKATIWETNPNLKVLLLVLIGVFLLSGIGLTVFAVWSNNYRQQVYEQTKAALPAHQEKNISISVDPSKAITLQGDSHIYYTDADNPVVKVVGQSIQSVSIFYVSDDVLNVYFKTTSTEDANNQIVSEFAKDSRVSGYSYVSSAQALQNFKDQHKDDPLISQSLNELGSNPLFATLSLKFFKPEDYSAVKQDLDADKYKKIISETQISSGNAVIADTAIMLGEATNLSSDPGTWTLPLPPHLHTLHLWAEAQMLDGKKLKTEDLGKVYDTK